MMMTMKKMKIVSYKDDERTVEQTHKSKFHVLSLVLAKVRHGRFRVGGEVSRILGLLLPECLFCRVLFHIVLEREKKKGLKSIF